MRTLQVTTIKSSRVQVHVPGSVPLIKQINIPTTNMKWEKLTCRKKLHKTRKVGGWEVRTWQTATRKVSNLVSHMTYNPPPPPRTLAPRLPGVCVGGWEVRKWQTATRKVSNLMTRLSCKTGFNLVYFFNS